MKRPFSKVCDQQDQILKPSSSKSDMGAILKPQRNLWNHKEIDRLARSSEMYEKKFGQVLQAKLGSDFKVVAHSSKFNRFDFTVSKIIRNHIKSSNPCDQVEVPKNITILELLQKRDGDGDGCGGGEEKIGGGSVDESPEFVTKSIRIELECGVMQKQWISCIHENRPQWVQGLNVVSRKIAEGQHFSIFIKHNMACNSFFAATYDFIKTHGIMKVQRKKAISFKTDNVVYSIPWSFVDEKDRYNTSVEFCFDNFDDLQILIEAKLENVE